MPCSSRGLLRNCETSADPLQQLVAGDGEEPGDTSVKGPRAGSGYYAFTDAFRGLLLFIILDVDTVDTVHRGAGDNCSGSNLGT